MKKNLIVTVFSGIFLILLSGCGTPKRPHAEINQLRNAAPPEMMSLPNPVRGQYFQDTWQAARSGGRKHEGVDIFAKKGTAVRSTTDGIVTKAGKNKLGGKVVGIQGAGAWHYYAHLDSIRVRLYEKVKAGQKIGTVGNTGNAKRTQPHLHYGVYPTLGGAVNPYPLIDQNR
ncbi:M23 family metallopeptidase [Neisseria animalis]|uniref:M23 family peptidase n=1 Tax=Neisseria animalis TaxID=492 RepID=A0A5P3MQ72_NEIAN|nr:M23 family metallopeptidase [Neisseria animalis]QEY23716.1 M23 family peptidase [Neisseria animalis]ROW32858.1 M23 family metallopeptidase [Neisseria animalis]VEE09546.1 peptidase [Neisseria animalis]